VLFNSYLFWLFFAIVALVYWRLERRAQNVWLLAVSYVFYACWDWRFTWLLALATALTYHCALAIDKPDATERQRKLWLTIGLVWNLGSLFFFKYCGWFVDSLGALMQVVGMPAPGWVVHIALPVGISFFSFQLVSYLADVYRQKSPATTDWLSFGLYAAFFPKLVAGPIERQDRLQPQFEEARPPMTEETFREGLFHVLTGLFKKVVIADNLAVIANHVYDRPAGEVPFPEFIIGTYALAFQVYGDFSGYSSIAQGVAKWLGIDLMTNFKNPYFSENPSEFWKRWHVSLSSALRDYIFMPLSFQRNTLFYNCRNLMITMLLGGLWHGASWTFVAWGAFHGLWLCVEAVWRKKSGTTASQKSKGLTHLAKVLGCFHLVCLSFVLFRSGSMDQIVGLLGGVLRSWQWTHFASFGLGYLAFFIVPLIGYEFWTEKRRDLLALTSVHWGWRTAVYAFIVLLMLFFPPPSSNEFVYFRF